MNFLKCNFLREHSFNVIFFTFFFFKGHRRQEERDGGFVDHYGFGRPMSEIGIDHFRQNGTFSDIHSASMQNNFPHVPPGNILTTHFPVFFVDKILQHISFALLVNSSFA